MEIDRKRRAVAAFAIATAAIIEEKNVSNKKCMKWVSVADKKRVDKKMVAQFLD